MELVVCRGVDGDRARAGVFGNEGIVRVVDIDTPEDRTGGVGHGEGQADGNALTGRDRQRLLLVD